MRIYFKRESLQRSIYRSLYAHKISLIYFSSSLESGLPCSGVSIITSWAPMPFILLYITCSLLLSLPSIIRAGKRLGITRTHHPDEFGLALLSLKASISSGVFDSLPEQKGHIEWFFVTTV